MAKLINHQKVLFYKYFMLQNIVNRYTYKKAQNYIQNSLKSNSISDWLINNYNVNDSIDKDFADVTKNEKETKKKMAGQLHRITTVNTCIKYFYKSVRSITSVC